MSTSKNWTTNGVSVGNTQFVDAFQRAEFWSLLGGTPTMSCSVPQRSLPSPSRSVLRASEDPAPTTMRPRNGTNLQIYAPVSLNTAGVFSSDISALSHEVAEAINDPTGANPTPS